MIPQMIQLFTFQPSKILYVAAIYADE